MERGLEGQVLGLWGFEVGREKGVPIPTWETWLHLSFSLGLESSGFKFLLCPQR